MTRALTMCSDDPMLMPRNPSDEPPDGNEHPVPQLLPSYVEIEINTYCNRRCSWCPNATSARGREKLAISEQVWNAILDSLGSAGYRGQFAFHNYNEPLADPGLLRYIQSARAALPDATLIIYTNGDYLDPERLDELASSALDEVRVTLYPDPLGSPSRSGARAQAFLAKLALPATSDESHPFAGTAVWRAQVRTMTLLVREPRVDRFTNRAGSVLSASAPVRTAPCYVPYQAAAIDVHGNLKLCCHIYDSLDPAATSCIIGNVGVEPLLSLWNSAAMNRRRAQVARADFSELPPCRTCNHVPSEALLRSLSRASHPGEIDARSPDW